MLCECGCGQATPVASKTRGDRGWIEGRPLRFVHGHQRGQQNWASGVVALLVERKADGWTFEMAWRDALKTYPPRGRDLGEATPTLFRQDDVSVVEFTEFVCHNAWHNYVGPEPGQGKALARFHPALLAAMSDSSEPAARMRPAA